MFCTQRLLGGGWQQVVAQARPTSSSHLAQKGQRCALVPSGLIVVIIDVPVPVNRSRKPDAPPHLFVDAHTQLFVFAPVTAIPAQLAQKLIIIGVAMANKCFQQGTIYPFQAKPLPVAVLRFLPDIWRKQTKGDWCSASHRSGRPGLCAVMRRMVGRLFAPLFNCKRTTHTLTQKELMVGVVTGNHE